MFKGRVLLFLTLSLFIAASVQGQSVTVARYERQVNVASPNARYYEIFTIKNSEDSLTQFQLCDKTAIFKRYAAIKALMLFKGQEGSKDLKVNEEYQLTKDSEDLTCFDLTIQQEGSDEETPFPKGEFKIVADVIISKVYNLLPEAILQEESQQIEFNGLIYRPLKYPIKIAEIKVVTEKQKKISFSRNGLVKQKKTRLEYQFKDIKPYQIEPLRVHLEMNRPLIEITSLTNEITISHYGNIYFDQYFEVLNWGAKQKPYWSRYQYQIDFQDRAPQHYIKALVLDTPKKARWMYFKDQIGNVSTSVVSRLADKTTVALKPRHPLFGGWKSIFQFGYSQPLSNLISKSQLGTFKFSYPIKTGLMDDHFVGDFQVKIVLPPGAEVVNIGVPAGSTLSLEKRYFYLDYFSRKTIVISRQNYVPYIQESMEIVYKYDYVAFLYKPMALIAGFFAFLSLFIFLGRMDFSVSRDQKWFSDVERKRLETKVERVFFYLKDVQIILDDIDNFEERLSRGLAGEIVKINQQELWQEWKNLTSKISENAVAIQQSTKDPKFKNLADNMIQTSNNLSQEGTAYIKQLSQDINKNELKALSGTKQKLKTYYKEIYQIAKTLDYD